MHNTALQPSISDLVASTGVRLTPTERRIASAVLDDPTLLAFGTVSALASGIGTSRPSIVRFATKLGFEGYSALQRRAQEEMSDQMSRPSERIRLADTSTVPLRVALERALSAVFDAVADEKIALLADPVVAAENVWIISGETSRAGAHALHSGLCMIRSNVHLVEEHSSASELAGAAPGDAAVVFDFSRYRRHAVIAAGALARTGVNVVAITDGPLSPLAAVTDTWCELYIPAIGPFDSSVPAVAIAELLVAYVSQHLRDKARDHIDQTEALWEANATFLA